MRVKDLLGLRRWRGGNRLIHARMGIEGIACMDGVGKGRGKQGVERKEGKGWRDEDEVYDRVSCSQVAIS